MKTSADAEITVTGLCEGNKPPGPARKGAKTEHGFEAY